MVEVINNSQTTSSSVKSIYKSGSKHNRNDILDYIREHQPITQYLLSKQLGINHTSIYQICREFEFAGLIQFRLEIGENNRTHKLITIPTTLINTKEELNTPEKSGVDALPNQEKE